MLNDTSPEAEAVLNQLFREAPDWRKIEMVNEMTKTVRMLAEAGVRERHPEACESEVKRRLADIFLGETLAEKAYGSFPATFKDCD